MSSQFNLPADDRPPIATTGLDNLWRRELEESVSRRFYEACDGVTQSLLTRCEWYMTTNASALTLVITCQDVGLIWRVLHNIAALGTHLQRFSGLARIRICPPPSSGTPFELRVDELSILQDAESGDFGLA